MKIVIEHKGVKRQIEGNGFNICGSQNDLLAIAEQIRANAEGMVFGWVKIRDEIPDEHYAGPNIQPKAWEE